VVAEARARSWKVSATFMIAVLLLWSVSSVCHWLLLAPAPVPAAGTTKVAAPAAIGRRAIAARIIIRCIFMRCFSFGEVGGWQLTVGSASAFVHVIRTHCAERLLPTAKRPTVNFNYTPARHGHTASRFETAVRHDSRRGPPRDAGGLRLAALHPRAEGGRLRARLRLVLPLRALRARLLRHRRAAGGADGPRRRRGRRGHRPGVLLLRHRRRGRPTRRDAGIRGHRPGRLQHRSEAD